MSKGEDMTFHFEDTADDFAAAVTILPHGIAPPKPPAQEELSEPCIPPGHTKQSAELAGMNTAFEIIQPPPGSTWPSRADIKGLFDHNFAYASSIITHDGNIYRMVKLRPYKDIDTLIQGVYDEAKEKFRDYPKAMIENHAVKVIIYRLEDAGFLRFIER